jgi:hypothetical protein
MSYDNVLKFRVTHVRMEGILEKFDSKEGGMFSAGVWRKYFFILHQDVLIFTDINERAKIVGKMHMQISKIIPEDQTSLDGEIRMNSGLIDVRLKASTIKEKINWKNALIAAQKKSSNDRYSAFDHRRANEKRDD